MISSPLNLFGQLLLLAVVCATPWAIAGVQPQVQAVLFVGVAVALLCTIGYLLTASAATGARSLPIALLPLTLAIGLGWFQLVPLSPSHLQGVSPQAVALRSQLLPPQDTSLAAGNEAASAAPAAPISLYPCSTRRDLALLILAAAVFFAGSILFSEPSSQTRLIWVLAVNGAAIAFFGLVQQLQSNRMLYGTIPLSAGTPFGPFVNRNNAGGFLTLCLAAALGAAVLAVSMATADSTPDYRRHGSRWSPSHWLPDLSPLLETRVLASLTLMACIVAGILSSLSRGATTAMLAAGLVVAGLAGVTHAKRRLPVLLGALVLGLALIAWVGRGETVRARLASLLDPQASAQEARLPHWQNALLAVPEFGTTGSGMGTYRYLYGMYEQQPQRAWFYHAENQYVEALVETGWPGLGLMVLLGLLLMVGAARLVRQTDDPTCYALGIAGLFALTAQAVSGSFDFGLHIPANLLTVALLLGVVAGEAARRARSLWRRPGAARPVAVALASLALAGVVWGTRQTQASAVIRTAIDQTGFLRQTTLPDPEESQQVQQAIDRLQQALDGCPDDAEAQLRLARCYVHGYRLALWQQHRSQAPDRDPESLWQATSMRTLHAFAQRADYRRSLREDPLALQYLLPARQHLLAARQACPLLPTVHVGLAELAFLEDHPAEELAHLDRARRLAPGLAELLLDIGLLDFQAGQTDRAYATWRRSLEIDARLMPRVLKLAGKQLNLVDVVQHVLPARPELLVQLARDRYAADADQTMRRLLLRRANDLLDQTNGDLDVAHRHYVRGTILALQEDHATAAEHFAQAVELQPDRIGWRYQWARCLLAQGRLEEAREQARWCGRMRPNEARYRQLLEQIYAAQF